MVVNNSLTWPHLQGWGGIGGEGIPLDSRNNIYLSQLKGPVRW